MQGEAAPAGGGRPDSADRGQRAPLPTGSDLPDASPEYDPAAVRDEAKEDETLRQQIRDASVEAFRRVEASAPPSVQVRLRAMRERIRSRRSLDTAWRMMVFALGNTLVLAGLIMFVIPGPGFATVILGLVVLGSEFTWATRVLDPVKDAARRASEAAMDPNRRKRNLALGGVMGVIVGVCLWVYLAEFGLTLDPVWDLAGAMVDWVKGLFG